MSRPYSHTRRLPYSPAQAVIDFIDECCDNGVPYRISRSDLNPNNRSMGSHLFTSLFWLRLIDAEGFTTAVLGRLADARKVGGEDWKSELRHVLYSAYCDVLGELKIETVTVDQLRDCFSVEHPEWTNSTLNKAASFFSALRSHSGLRIVGSRSPAGMRIPATSEPDLPPNMTPKKKSARKGKKMPNRETVNGQKITLEIMMKGEIIGELKVDQKITQEEYEDIGRSFDGLKAYLSTFVTES